MKKALVNQTYLLEKYPGKGGWTYAAIPEVVKNKKSPFGWVKVKGSIDGYKFENYKLMPMGNGKLFLPVKAEIRKKLGKEARDWVKIILFTDKDKMKIPEELLECFKLEALAYKNFLKYSEGQKKEMVDWIYSAKTLETKSKRIADSLKTLSAVGVKKRSKAY